MAVTDDSLLERVEEHLEQKYSKVFESPDMTTLELEAGNYLEVCEILHSNPAFFFEQLTDLCGVDYSEYPKSAPNKFAVVLHLLSYRNNERLRVRVWVEDDEFPVIPSVNHIWRGANWFEREAFDLFGIMFSGHPDLRRILTDYGFVGHPFRKDFPMVGHVEMRYDPKQQRVIYEPVSIKERIIVPKTDGTGH